MAGLVKQAGAAPAAPVVTSRARRGTASVSFPSAGGR
jgi:hypothetical protein